MVEATKQAAQWAQEITIEVDKMWKDHSFLKDGYAVFYSPVIANPRLLIVGFNPGGDHSSFDRRKASEVPEHHEYLTQNYAIAKKMRNLFQTIGKFSILEQSVKTNLLFFRSRSISQWHEINPQVRNKLEQFCASKLREIIDVLRPQFILAEGIKTYTHLRALLSFEDEETVIKSKNRTLFAAIQNQETTLIGIIHPTGARVSRIEWELIQVELDKRFRETTE